MVPLSRQGGPSAEGKNVRAHFPEALERTMSAARTRLEAKLVREREIAVNHEDRAKSLESQLKALDTGLAIAGGEQSIAVSLLYKRGGGGAYIKGRCWWNGRQREVQIGTIPAVLARFKRRKRKSVSSPHPSPTWDEVKADVKLMKDIKELGREKLRAYIIKQLLNDYLPDYSQPAADKVESARLGRQTDAAPGGLPPLAGAGDWYSRWHQENLLGESVA